MDEKYGKGGKGGKKLGKEVNNPSHKNTGLILLPAYRYLIKFV